jgi:diguanylate cyclase (GGDEF)-like protein
MIRILKILALLLIGANTMAASSRELLDQLAQLEKTDEDNQPQKAVTLVQQLAPQLESLSPIDQGRFLVMQGIVQEDIQRDIKSADSSFNRAIRLLEAQPQPSQPLADAYYERAYIKYIRTHNTAEYCPDRQKAVAITRTQQTHTKLAKYLTALSFCYTDSPAHFQEGLALLNEAMTLAESMKLSAMERGMIYNASALLYRSNQLYQQAYDYSQLAYEKWKVDNNLPGMDNQQHNMLVDAINIGELGKADQHSKELFKLADSAPQYKDFRFFAYFDAGQVALAHNDFAKAAHLFEQARGEEGNTEESLFIADNRTQLASAYLMKGDIDAALREAKAIAQSPGYAALDTYKKNLIQSLMHFDHQQPVKAMQSLYTLYRDSEQRRRDFVKNASLAYASTHDNRVQKYEKQLLENQLRIKQLELDAKERQQEASQLYLAITLITLVSLSLVAHTLWRSRRRFRTQAQIDALTGVAVRRYFLERATQLALRHRNQDLTVSVMMMDIDHFKRINDTFGHQAGDEAIRHVAARAFNCLRETDLFGRTGGEEFVALLPATDEDSAWQIAEKIRQDVERAPLVYCGDQIHITVSIGLVTSALTEDNIETLMQLADLAMYRAKNSGRNHSCSHAKDAANLSTQETAAVA